MTRILQWAVTTLAAVTAFATPTAAPPWAETYSAALRTACAGLPVATEVRTGYGASP